MFQRAGILKKKLDKSTTKYPGVDIHFVTSLFPEITYSRMVPCCTNPRRSQYLPDLRKCSPFFKRCGLKNVSILATSSLLTPKNPCMYFSSSDILNNIVKFY